MTCHYNRSQPVSAFVVNRLVNGLFRCMRSCEIFETGTAVLSTLVTIVTILSLSQIKTYNDYDIVTIQQVLNQSIISTTTSSKEKFLLNKFDNKTHSSIKMKKKLSCKSYEGLYRCWRPNVLVTNLTWWWPIQYIEKITNITKKVANVIIQPSTFEISHHH